MNHARRIVITGMGVVSPLGTGNDAFWQSLVAGKSGVAEIAAFPTNGVGTRIAAEVRDFDPKNYVKQKKSIKVMARDIQLAVGGAQIAVEHAGLDRSKVDPTRFGVNFGAAMIATELDELGLAVSHSVNGTRKFDLQRWGLEGMSQLYPLWMLKYLPNMPACHISIFYDAQGPNNSITCGDSSATLAAGEAFRILQRGSADVFLVGGTDSKIHPLSIVRLALLKRLSQRFEDPEQASRPFDVERDGIVPGEGAGILIFEELQHAKTRGAKIHGEVVGFGASCHPKDISIAVEKAVKRAIKDAGLVPKDLGHIAAHAAGEVVGDRQEAIGLARVLGDAASAVPIVAYKSSMGHLCAGCGTVELIASVLALKHGELPATLNFVRGDADAPKLAINIERTECAAKPFVSYTRSTSGQCAAIVVRPFVG